jgi:hypothetical protein
MYTTKNYNVLEGPSDAVLEVNGLPSGNNIVSGSAWTRLWACGMGIR